MGRIMTSTKELKHEIEFLPAWDKRDCDPEKNYGISGVSIRFIVSGQNGAVQFVLSTNWHLPHVQKELEKKYFNDLILFAPIPSDVGYHSLRPMYDGQKPITDKCKYLGGKPCYYDGSSLAAQDYFETLVTEGDDALWERLEDYYHKLFKED